MKALEYIKSKHNGEIPYKYGANECAKLMEAYAEARNKELSKCTCINDVGTFDSEKNKTYCCACEKEV